MTLGVAVDAAQVARFSGVGERVYRNAKAALQKVLGVTSKATARELCVQVGFRPGRWLGCRGEQAPHLPPREAAHRPPHSAPLPSSLRIPPRPPQFGCAGHEPAVRAALAAYKDRFVRSLPAAQQRHVDFGRPVFLAAAFYLVARKKKVAVRAAGGGVGGLVQVPPPGPALVPVCLPPRLHCRSLAHAFARAMRASRTLHGAPAQHLTTDRPAAPACRRRPRPPPPGGPCEAAGPSWGHRRRAGPGVRLHGRPVPRPGGLRAAQAQGGGAARAAAGAHRPHGVGGRGARGAGRGGAGWGGAGWWLRRAVCGGSGEHGRRRCGVCERRPVPWWRKCLVTSLPPRPAPLQRCQRRR